MRRTILILGFLILAMFQTVSAVAAPAADSVYVVLWPGLTWDVIANDPWFQAQDLLVGNMNVRTAGGTTYEAAFLTIASGARAPNVRGAGEVLVPGENIEDRGAGELYTFRTGYTVEPGALVFPALPLLEAETSKLKYTFRVGLLGSAAQEAGVKVAAFGNSDAGSDRYRWAGLVALDARGQVASGVIDRQILIEDASYPFSLRTDYRKLAEAVLSSSADINIIDLGDPFRLEAYGSRLSEERYAQLTDLVNQQALEFLHGLIPQLPASAAWMILAGHAGKARAGRGHWLAPVIVGGQGRSGLLYTSTTRWPGVVTNVDAAPAILDSIGIDLPLAGVVGRSFWQMPKDLTMTTKEVLTYVQATEQRILQTANRRGWVLRVVVGLQIAAYLVGVILLIIPWPVTRPWIRVYQAFLVLLVAVPAGFLLMARYPWGMLALFALLSLLLWRSGDYPAVIGIIGGLSALLIIGDQITGYGLIRFSYLGYDALGGARYYGIGNEYMGVLIGSTIMAWAILRSRVEIAGAAWWDLVVFAATAAAVALPMLGANFGGAVTAVAGFGVLWLTLNRGGIRTKDGAGLLLLMVVVIGGLMAWDHLTGSEAQSHMGRTITTLREEGLNGLFLIIQRKLSMNLMLFRYSIWTRGLIAAIITMGASLIWPSRLIHWIKINELAVLKGILAVLMASIVAFFINDSGVVAAATCIAYAASTLLILAVGLKHNLLPTQPNVKN